MQFEEDFSLLQIGIGSFITFSVAPMNQMKGQGEYIKGVSLVLSVNPDNLNIDGTPIATGSI